MRCTSSSHTGSKLTWSTGTVVVLCNGGLWGYWGCCFPAVGCKVRQLHGAVNITWHLICVFIPLSSQLFGQRENILSFIQLHPFPKWHLGQQHSQSIYICWKIRLRGTSEDDSLMSSVTANLAVWEWEGAARVFISLGKINISDLGWEGESFSRVKFLPSSRVTAVRGCTRSLPPIFAGCLSKLRIVTEVVLLLNACIRQLLAGNLMNPAALDEYVCKRQRHSKKCRKTYRAGPRTLKLASSTMRSILILVTPICMPNTVECMFCLRKMFL